MQDPLEVLQAGTHITKKQKKEASQVVSARTQQAQKIEGEAPEDHIAAEDRPGRLRRLNAISVKGESPVEPIETFSSLLHPTIITRLHRFHVINPSSVQMQALPIVMDPTSYDCVITAPTGSGKTVAFAAPIAQSLLTSENGQPVGVAHLVISPTKELCYQTERVLATLTNCSEDEGTLEHFTASSSRKQKKSKRVKSQPSDSNENDTADSKARGPSVSLLAQRRVMLATPKAAAVALKELQQDETNDTRTKKLQRVVLDEADRLLQAGFYEHVVECLAGKADGEETQRVVVSAALPDSVEALARQELMRDSPSVQVIRVSVGERTTPCENVKQELRFVSQETGKPLALRQLVQEGLSVPCLVFAATRKRAQLAAEEIAASTSAFVGRVALVHAGMSESDRQQAISRFRDGRTWILVATDLVARGMDFLGLATVINIDLPQSRAEYVHRVGRAGRAGRIGFAVSFFTEDDWRDLRPIADAVRSSGSHVPQWMLQMPKVDKRKPRSERSSILQQPEVYDGNKKLASQEETERMSRSKRKTSNTETVAEHRQKELQQKRRVR